MKRFLFFAIASLLFVACDNKFEDVGNTIQGVSTLPTLTAEFADENTRTYVEDDFYLRWHEGDLISAFLGNSLNNKYMFNGATGDNSGTFSAVSSAELGSNYGLSHIYALYPYDQKATIAQDGTISCTLPAVQEYAVESFGKGANTMVAVTKDASDAFLGFKNVCGYLKIKLYGDATVESIELKGNNGEKIAGAATIATAYGAAPQVVMSDDATDSITLDCGDGVELSTDAENPTEFWFVVPPTEFSEGLTIVATDTNGVTFVKSTSNAVTITRNEIQPMSAIEAILREPKCPNNEIWYTSSDCEIVEPYRTNVFGANIVSNNYKDGKGVITFDGDVTTIGNYAFYDCDSLTTITIPDSVTTIGDAAFFYCTSLTSVTIPDSVTTIGRSAFYECTSLTTVTIPDSVTAIGDSAFSSCDSLKEFKGKFASDNGRCLIVDGVLNSFANGCGATEYTIPDSVTTIGYAAFYGCTSLTSVTIPDSVTTIGEGAFCDCTSLTSVTIPDSVTTIGDMAFQYCKSLTSVIIPNSVTTIGIQTFYHCENLTSVTIPDSITTIGDLAFYGCTSLTSLTIPHGVIEIQGWAFDGCTSLTSVIIPESITCIHYFAFRNCENLVSIYCKSVYPPNLVYLSQDGLRYWNAFDNNAIDRKIYVPQGSGEYYRVNDGWNLYAEDIVEYDFTTENESSDDAANSEIWYTSTDGNIVEPNKTNVFGANIISNIYKDGKGVITFNGNVTMIGFRAFSSCDNLKSITIPDGVKTIGVYAFSSCDNLTSVTIPDSVTSILGVAFGWCSSLASITIPNSVSIIGEAAFYECNNLKKVYCMPTTPPTSYHSFQWSAFDNNATGRKIYVPRGCVEAYKSAPKWSDYAADIVEYDF